MGKWSFNDQSNPGEDTSGNNNHATLSGDGLTWKTASECGLAFRGCLYFDGEANYISLPNVAGLRLTGNFTISERIKLKHQCALSGCNGNVLYSTRNYESGYTWGIGINNIVALSVPGGAGNPALGNTAITLNTWTHLAVTHSGTTTTLYKDGVAFGSSTQTPVDGGPPAIGKEPTGAGRTVGSQDPFVQFEFLKAFIDEVRVYNRALSVGEIQAL